MPHGEARLLIFLVCGRTVKRCSLAVCRLGEGFARVFLGVRMMVVMARAMLMLGVMAESGESKVLVRTQGGNARTKGETLEELMEDDDDEESDEKGVA